MNSKPFFRDKWSYKKQKVKQNQTLGKDLCTCSEIITHCALVHNEIHKQRNMLKYQIFYQCYRLIYTVEEHAVTIACGMYGYNDYITP